MSYSDYCGLVLNVGRVELRRAVASWRGTSLANSKSDVSVAYADAMAEFTEAADEMAFELNADRMEARTLERVLSGNRGFIQMGI